MSDITTHVLDTSRGRPAEGVPVVLEVQSPDESWKILSAGTTDADGRLKFYFPPGFLLAKGDYRLVFDTATYFRAQHVEGLYPGVTIVFTVRDTA